MATSSAVWRPAWAPDSIFLLLVAGEWGGSGSSFSAAYRALVSAAAERMIASAVAWSEVDGGEMPIVCQDEDLALRNSAVQEVWTIIHLKGDLVGFFF